MRFGIENPFQEPATSYQSSLRLKTRNKYKENDDDDLFTFLHTQFWKKRSIFSRSNYFLSLLQNEPFSLYVQPTLRDYNLSKSLKNPVITWNEKIISHWIKMTLCIKNYVLEVEYTTLSWLCSKIFVFSIPWPFHRTSPESLLNLRLKKNASPFISRSLLQSYIFVTKKARELLLKARAKFWYTTALLLLRPCQLSGHSCLQLEHQSNDFPQQDHLTLSFLLSNQFIKCSPVIFSFCRDSLNIKEKLYLSFGGAEERKNRTAIFF